MSDPEQTIRILRRKLERSETARAYLEKVRDNAQSLYQGLQNELDEARVALERSNDDLRRAQEQLIEQEKLASLGQLTAGIAHEIKNPLNFINNFAQLNAELAEELREALSDADPDVHELLSDLKQNATLIAEHGKRADTIVRAMMQHASGGRGERQRVRLNTFVAENVDLAYHGKRTQMQGRRAEIVKDFAEGDPMVELVPQDIGRVLVNLISNALDAVQEKQAADTDFDSEETYMPGIVITTRADKDRVEIQISDNGPGIPPDIQKNIFEPFFTTKPTGSGTGLGLSMSHDIVTKGHGGTIQVESTEGKGTTFVIRLPKK